MPPGVSAIKVNGQRAYKLTRAGAAPELAARPVTVRQFSITGTRRDGDLLDVGVVVRCSSGTYIRALARDLGAALGTGGHLTALRRTAVGPYTIAMAHTAQRTRRSTAVARTGAGKPGLAPRRRAATRPLPRSRPPPGPPARASAVIPLAEAAAAAFPRLDLTDDDARRLAQGARLPLPPDFPPSPEDAKDRPAAAFAPDGSLVALVTAADGRLRSLAVFV